MDKKQPDRRHFLKTSLEATAIAAISAGSLTGLLESCSGSRKISIGTFHTGFEQTPLPYAYNALENVIDAQTMEIHYSKHAATYAKNLKEAATAENADMKAPLESLLANISSYSVKMRNNAGGHYNHEMFWQCMRPARPDNHPEGTLSNAIQKKFGSLDHFKKTFADAGKNRFGSGWAWLCKDDKGELLIGSTANQDNPLMNISGMEVKGFPLLNLDVWEHAYYLKYQNKRSDYIENWWNVVNWDYVGKRFAAV